MFLIFSLGSVRFSYFFNFFFYLIIFCFVVTHFCIQLIPLKILYKLFTKFNWKQKICFIFIIIFVTILYNRRFVKISVYLFLRYYQFINCSFTLSHLSSQFYLNIFIGFKFERFYQMCCYTVKLPATLILHISYVEIFGWWVSNSFSYSTSDVCWWLLCEVELHKNKDYLVLLIGHILCTIIRPKSNSASSFVTHRVYRRRWRGNGKRRCKWS